MSTNVVCVQTFKDINFKITSILNLQSMPFVKVYKIKCLQNLCPQTFVSMLYNPLVTDTVTAFYHCLVSHITESTHNHCIQVGTK